jgi:hypothetical protein
MSANDRYCRKRILWVFPRNIDSREEPYSQHRFKTLFGSILLLRFGLAPRTFSTASTHSRPQQEVSRALGIARFVSCATTDDLIDGRRRSFIRTSREPKQNIRSLHIDVTHLETERGSATCAVGCAGEQGLPLGGPHPATFVRARSPRQSSL